MNEITQIQFRIEVLQGNLPDVVVNATTHLEAKTIILDRLVTFFLFSNFFTFQSEKIDEKGLFFLPSKHK